MNKKLVYLSAAIATGLLLGAGFIVFEKFKAPSPELIKPLSEEKDKKESFNYEWIKWEDPAGFSFEYPEDANIDNHPEDEINYANLELTTSQKKGKISILVNDSEYGDMDEWLKNDKLAENNSALETEIASFPAKRVSLGNGREIAGFIDSDQVLYLIDYQPEEEPYWQEVYKNILSTFKLIPLEGESEEEFSNWLQDFDTSEADIVEPVEVIE